MNELPIVVTCTDRKTAPPAAGLRIRELPETGIPERVGCWEHRLRTAPGPRVTLGDLYQGDQWRQAQALSEAALRAGFTPRLYVASAGLGLRPVSSLAPSYAATFTPRHEDSVTSSSERTADWWDHLQRMDGARSLRQLAAAGRLLLVLSETYAQAMHRDLVALAATGSDAVLVGGASSITGIHRVPANAALRNELGGTLTSLNTRTAARWLAHCTPGRLITPAAEKRWDAWVERHARPERYARQPMTDDEIVAFIRHNHALNPDCSRTRLLRLLRDEGKACEQKRFADLYASTIGRR